MNAVLKGALVAFMGFSLAYGADFSKASDEELQKLAGKVKVSDYADYQLEVAKRLKDKKKEDVKTFRDKQKEQYKKNTEGMKVKDYREYKDATRKAMQERVEKMSVKEFRESGLGGGFKGAKHPPKGDMKRKVKDSKDKK